MSTCVISFTAHNSLQSKCDLLLQWDTVKYQTRAILVNSQEAAEPEMEFPQKPEQLPRHPLPCPSRIIGPSHVNARERKLLIWEHFLCVPVCIFYSVCSSEQFKGKESLCRPVVWGLQYYPHFMSQQIERVENYRGGVSSKDMWRSPKDVDERVLQIIWLRASVDF